MPIVWNLKTNSFDNVDVLRDDCEYHRIESSDSRVIHVETNLAIRDLGDGFYSGGIADNEVYRPAFLNALKTIWEAGLDKLGPPDSLDEWIASFKEDQFAERTLCFFATCVYLVDRFAKNKPLDERIEVFKVGFQWQMRTGVPETSILSKARVRRLTKELDGLNNKVVFTHFEISLDELFPADFGVKIYLKSFFKEGIGFCIGRIENRSSTRLSKIGIAANSPEHAELLLLRQLSAAASYSSEKDSLEIYSSQRNIVNWLNGVNRPRTYEELRCGIELGLSRSYSSYQADEMSDVLKKNYKNEKMESAS